MPTATSPTTPIAPIYVVPSVPVSTISAIPIPAVSIALTFTSPRPLSTAPSQFEVGSNSAAVTDPISEAMAFFTRFDQLEVNNLDPENFWGSSPPYVDFHGFRVPEDCVSHLEAIYSSRGDFMQGFHLGCSAREHFLKMLGSVMNDITLLTLSFLRGSFSGELQFKSLLVWASLWSSFWIIFARFPEPFL
ncbi:hypothetical protein SO802_012713 [Lithocarpus litseifolius]|uniref:Uncharacterized protein n=1 Tax=Lithocarpus litseifolius TaxID=425828 RepID=A0AAW2D3J0_9ROSI